MSDAGAVASPIELPAHPLVGQLSALHHFRVYVDVGVVVVVAAAGPATTRTAGDTTEAPGARPVTSVPLMYEEKKARPA